MAFIQTKANIFRNDNKASEKHPDWSGKFEIEGEMMQALIDDYKQNQGKAMISIAFWDATQGSTGKTYFSANLSCRAGDDGGQGYKKPEPKPEPKPIQDLDDDIPF